MQTPGDPTKRNAVAVLFAFVGFGVLGVADWYLSDIHVGALALVPLLVIAYYGSRPLAVGTAVVSASVFSLLDHDYLGKHVVVGSIPIDAAILAASFCTVLLVVERFRASGIENALLSAELTRVQTTALRDSLTELPNRASFAKHLEEAIVRVRSKTGTVAVLFADLDGFKSVNDVYGHDVGDVVLGSAARRLLNALRAEDFVARIGGDEFAIILMVDSTSEVDHIVTTLEEKFKEPFSYGTEHHQVGVTIGVSFAPQDGEDPTKLLRLADERMYRRKRQKKDDGAAPS